MYIIRDKVYKRIYIYIYIYIYILYIYYINDKHQKGNEVSRAQRGAENRHIHA